MEYQHIDMLQAKRVIGFPFQISSLGYIRHTPQRYARNCYREKVEFCVRLHSNEEFAEDVLDGVIRRTKFPHVIIKPPDVVHEYTVRGAREAFYFMYPSEVISRLEICGVTLSPLIWEVTISEQIAENIAALRELSGHSQEYGVAEALDLRAFMLLEQLVLMRGTHAEPSNFRHESIRQAASYLKLHWREQRNIGDVAKRFGMSRRTFYRNWQEFMGGTPAEYIDDLQSAQARRMLEATSLSIREIAEKCGLDDTAYFIEKFKLHHGVTPRTFRIRHAEQLKFGKNSGKL